MQGLGRWKKTGRLLGRGEAGSIHEYATGSKDAAQKKFKNDTQGRKEIRIHQFASSFGLAPQIYEVIKRNGMLIVFMEKLTPVTTLTMEQQKQLVDTVAELVKRGIIHNDLHHGNVMLNSAKRVLVTDYGLAQQTRFPISASSHLFRQTMIATLSSLLDPCNENNPGFKKNMNGMCNNKKGNLKHIVDVIYRLKNGVSYT